MVIPVNHHVHHVVRLRQAIVALAIITRQSLGVMRHHVAHHAANQLAVLKNAGMTVAANVIAEKFATNKANLICKT
ncbi:hypothetical protein [Candidatus Berkiella aquae]|uniref:Uncharacterized protein n=1 Tax=Candidatus Berkiella aquae TaxID=295108 RepID=A0AAE3HTG6_9GAMM|nr:hypothetical protein [Candidatus Berkiella aquae]MCS5710368.1 hypothetical protein [Candidatus Berkiella aquae]